MKTAIGYVRVSTFRQADEGISIDAQKQKIKQWCDLNNAKLLEIFSDNGISGSSNNRPGFQAALDAAIKHQGIFVCYSMSRFYRGTIQTLRLTEQLEKAGADLVFINEQIDTCSPGGKMVFRIMAALNEFEVDQIRERTKMALDYRKSQGKKLGGDVPFGYDADSEGYLSENPTEQNVIKIIRKQLGSHGLNYSQMAAYLNKNKHLTKRGLKWYPQTVKNVVEAMKKADAELL